MRNIHYTITPKMAGNRLDAILGLLYPQYSLRTRRRILKNAKLNGIDARAGYRPKSHDILEFNIPEQPNLNPDLNLDSDFKTGASFIPILLDYQLPFYFFHKPEKVHTLSLAGQANPDSFEEAARKTEYKSLILLQRLDYHTSGIITACATEEACKKFKSMEKSGKIRKYYLTVMDGNFEQPIVAKGKIDTRNRKKSRLTGKQAESVRQTIFYPLAYLKNNLKNPDNAFISNFENENYTLAIARINCGVRHQIRVHAKGTGHPLTGDALYGMGSGTYFLHNFCIVIDDQLNAVGSYKYFCVDYNYYAEKIYAYWQNNNMDNLNMKSLNIFLETAVRNLEEIPVS